MYRFCLSVCSCSILLLLFAATTVWAQQVVSGKVTSGDDGSSIPGVNVVEKGTSNGAVTDTDGNFRITVGSGATLSFSFVGYQTSEVVVGAQSTINVTLESSVTSLSEVVVIGYGEVSARDATGAVASVSSKDFNGGVIASPEQLLQGKTAGVQITNTTGSPGAAVQIRIRGTSSIRSNNNPLFVVDGVPLSGGTQSASADVGYGSSPDTNPLSFLNPSDIESISILKDASATAIYGSRGANGVVLITTKKGRGKSNFEFTSNLSISSARKNYDLLNGGEFLDAVEQYGGDRSAQNYGSNTDWQDYILRTSVSNKQNLSYSRGFKTGSLRASLGYEDQQGIMVHSDMKRYSVRLNGDKTFFNEKLKLDLSSTFSSLNREDPPTSGNAGSTGDLLGAAYMANPTWSTDPDFNSGSQRSPANMLAYYKSTGTTNRVLTNFSATYSLSDELSAKATYGIDLSRGDRYTLISGDAKNGGDGVQGYGMGQLNKNNTTSNLVELTMNYTKKTDNVSIELVGGYSYQSFRNQYYWAPGRGFTDYSSFSAMKSELKNSFNAADDAASALYSDYSNWGVADVLLSGSQGTGGFVGGIDFENNALSQKYFEKPPGVTLEAIGANFYDQTDYLQSYFGRGNFIISNKYLITATLRVDGSSKFGSDHRYGVFPSGAIAWKLNEEDFVPEFFSTLKLRAGYGVVGNQDGLGYGEFIRRERWADVSVNSSRQISVPGTTTQGSVNPSLRWESTAQTSVGFDFGILNEKLSGSFDFYVKETTDLLLKRTAAQPSVATQIFDNLDATVENKGWELTLNYNVIEQNDISLTFSGNLSHNKNMLKDFDGVLDAGTIYGQGLSNAYAQRLAGGHPLFSYHLREFEGFDANGQPIGDEQKFVGKTALPTWNVGFSINARYKAFDLSAYLTGQYGHYVYNNTRNAFFTAGAINNAHNVTHDVLTSGESGSAEAAVSTRFLEKGDFARMQNLSIGYRVPITKGFIKNMRVSITGQNLFVITDYTGLDPEVSTSPANSDLLNGLPTAGIDYVAYPRPRTFTLGLTATF